MGNDLQLPRKGDVFRAAVQKITRRNVILRLSNGLPCLMDASYLVWLTRPTVKIRLKKGSELDVEVKVVSPGRRPGRPYIYVGHRHTDERPWDRAQRRHGVGRRECCNLVEFVPGGAIVAFGSGFWGWLPDAEVTWGRPTKALDAYRRGEEIEVAVHSHDHAKHRIIVSPRLTQPRPADTHPSPLLREAEPPGTPAPVPCPTLTEGAPHVLELTAYERNAEARSRCLAYYGVTCFLCGFDFGVSYGPLAAGLIHVHHLVPLAESGGEHAVDPIRDLRPVCPNCHAVIHVGGGTLSIEAVKKLLAEAVERRHVGGAAE